MKTLVPALVVLLIAAFGAPAFAAQPAAPGAPAAQPAAPAQAATAVQAPMQSTPSGGALVDAGLVAMPAFGIVPQATECTTRMDCRGTCSFGCFAFCNNGFCDCICN